MHDEDQVLGYFTTENKDESVKKKKIHYKTNWLSILMACRPRSSPYILSLSLFLFDVETRSMSFLFRIETNQADMEAERSAEAI